MNTPITKQEVEALVAGVLEDLSNDLMTDIKNTTAYKPANLRRAAEVVRDTLADVSRDLNRRAVELRRRSELHTEYVSLYADD